MPILSAFYGLAIYMYDEKSGKHNKQHINVYYSGEDSVISIPDGDIIEGNLKKSKLKLIQAWLEIHQEEIMLNWDLISRGEDIVKIDPLK